MKSKTRLLAVPRVTFLATMASLCISSTVQANETSSTKTFPFTYETFEAAVPHLDLETCPKSLPQVDSFCRAAIRNEEIHVFAFSLNGDSPMVGFASFSAEGLDALLE